MMGWFYIQIIIRLLFEMNILYKIRAYYRTNFCYYENQWIEKKFELFFRLELIKREKEKID